MELPKRKHPRFKNYDYSSNGYYFITFCVENPKVTLPTVPDLMKIIKSKSARRFNQHDNTPGRKVYQTSYMDEIIGSVKYYEEVWRYIDENPAKWLITKKII